MSRAGGGIGLAARFTLIVAVALLVVGGVCGALLMRGASTLIERREDDLVRGGARLTAEVEGDAWRPTDGRREDLGGGVTRERVLLAGERGAQRVAVGGAPGRALFLPLPAEPLERRLFGLFAAVGAAGGVVVLLVAAWGAHRITRPLGQVIAAVRQISIAEPRYRGRVTGGGREIASLSRALDRMSAELASAREAEAALGSREHELALATEVRDALLPLGVPLIDGLDLGATRLGGAGLDGAFHDFIELDGGRVGLLVGEVGAGGLPGALIGATARAFLRSSLRRTVDPGQALAEVNRELVRGLPRGAWVSALYALVDLEQGAATVACAGHRVPLLRLSASDGNLRVFQPGGLALGLDRGPVFDKRLEVQRLEFARGDRLVLATASAAMLADDDGTELGERGLYERVRRASDPDTDRFLRAIRDELERFSQDRRLPGGVSIVTVLRSA